MNDTVSGKQKPKRGPTVFQENLGKVFIDLGKLLFGSFLLGGVLRGGVPQVIIILAGGIGSFGFIGFGLYWTSRKKDKKDEDKKED